MKKMTAFMLVCCMALMAVPGAGAQSTYKNKLFDESISPDGEEIVPVPAAEVMASSVASVLFSLFPLTLWAPVMVMLGMMAGSMLW